MKLLALMEASMLLAIELSPGGLGLTLLALANTVDITTLVLHAPAPWLIDAIPPEG